MQGLKKMGFFFSTFTTEIAIDNDGIEASVLDVMIARFPHVATDIFKELDNETLTNCRKVNRLWCDHLDDQKLCSLRMIQRHNRCMTNWHVCQKWKKVLKNIPVGYVKELSISTLQYVKDDPSRNKFYWSPLQVTADQGNLELCKYIFEKTKNSKPEECKLTCMTALHMAVNKGHGEICEFIINNSLEKNPPDKNGMTPLHYAAKRGLTNVCKLIIANIDNKNPAATNGCTPLHLAAKKGHLEIIRLIVETGVDKTTLFNGNTPLDSLNKFRSYNFYKLLCKDYFQLGCMIIQDFVIHFLTYLMVFLGLLFLNLISSMVYAVSFCELDCHKTFSNVFGHGVLVSAVIAFPLTIPVVKVCLYFVSK